MDQTDRSEGGVRLASLPGIVRENLHAVTWGQLLSLRSLGFALARAWVYLMFIGAAASVVSWNGAPLPGAVFSVSTVVLFLSMIVAGFANEGFVRLVSHAGARWLGPVLTCAGTLLVASTTLPGAPQELLCALGGIATGMGSGIIDMGYGELYRNVPSTQTCIEAPFSFLIAALVYLVVSTLPTAAACVVTALLPMLAGVILFGKYQVWSPATRPATRPVPISVTRFAVRIGACACLVGLADGVVRAVFMEASGTTAQQFYQEPLLWASLVSVVVIWACALFSPSFSLRGVYKIAVVIMAFCFQLLPIFVETQLQNVLALAGYGTFNVLIWILLADVAYTYRLSSVAVFGVGWSMLTIGVFLGSLAGRLVVGALAPFSPQVLSGVALAATLAILLSYMFILKESDLVRLTSLGEQGQERADGSREGDGARAVPRFANRCRQIAAQRGLTERETEIMILYAKGRSYARLQDELSLSRGTITTHLTHIYQKLGVHDKQELLDYIEGRREA